LLRREIYAVVYAYWLVRKRGSVFELFKHLAGLDFLFQGTDLMHISGRHHVLLLLRFHDNGIHSLGQCVKLFGLAIQKHAHDQRKLSNVACNFLSLLLYGVLCHHQYI
jgi:hypothetical protein